MHIVIAQRRISLFATLLTTSLLIILSSFLLITLPAHAAPDLKAAPDNYCAGISGDESFTTRFVSPFPYTSTMCLGKTNGPDGLQFFQFAVTLPGPIKNASIQAKNGKGESIAFANTGNGILYVSLPGSSAGESKKGMGYGAATQSCSRTDPVNNITITATGNGKSSSPKTINLCNVAEKDSVFSVTTDTLVADSGAVTKTGSIEGRLGVVREGAAADHPARSGLLQMGGVSNITLTNLDTNTVVHREATNNPSANWYTLTDGHLVIRGLPIGDAGVTNYGLVINYNDRLLADSSDPSYIQEWTSDNIELTFVASVPANETVWISNVDGTTVQYYNATGEIVDIATLTEAEDAPSSCVIDGIGWIICPVMNFMAKIVDGAYGVVSSLLTTPNIDTSTTSGTYKAWEAMRTIANVAFVIVFLIIIFSQLTSVGITNYGVKKMLPRIIVAAILVNASYLLCAIAVDISNILGSSIKQIFDNVGGQLTGPALQAGPSQTGAGWEGAVGFLLAGSVLAAATIYAGLSVLLPALIAALAAIVTVFLVLTLRQALIIILIVIAPLAFVAFLLPNTESLFTKWRKLLTTLLLMYPIIAGIFGASALASTVIMNSSPDFPVQVMGALVAIIPLFITPIVMKSAGGVLNRFGGMVNNPNKGPFDRMKKGAAGYRNNRKEFRNLKAITGDGRTMPGMRRFSRAKAKRSAILNNRKAELNRANADYVSKEEDSNEKFSAQLAKGGGEGAASRASASALNVKLKLAAEEVENEVKRTIEKGDPITMKQDVKRMFVDATKSGDTTKALAAQRILATKLGAPGIQALQDGIHDVETTGGGHAETITELKRSMGDYALKGKDNATTTWGYSGATIATIRADPGTYSSLTPTELSGQNLRDLHDAAVAGILTTSQAESVRTNPNATQLLSQDKKDLFHAIENGLPIPPLP